MGEEQEDFSYFSRLLFQEKPQIFLSGVGGGGGGGG